MRGCMMWVRNEVKRKVRAPRTLAMKIFERLGVVPTYGPRVKPESDGKNICNWHKRGDRRPIEHTVQLKSGWVGLCCAHYAMFNRLQQARRTDVQNGNLLAQLRRARG